MWALSKGRTYSGHKFSVKVLPSSTDAALQLLEVCAAPGAGHPIDVLLNAIVQLHQVMGRWRPHFARPERDAAVLGELVHCDGHVSGRRVLLEASRLPMALCHFLHQRDDGLAHHTNVVGAGKTASLGIPDRQADSLRRGDYNKEHERRRLLDPGGVASFQCIVLLCGRPAMAHVVVVLSVLNWSTVKFFSSEKKMMRLAGAGSKLSIVALAHFCRRALVLSLNRTHFLLFMLPQPASLTMAMMVDCATTFSCARDFRNLLGVDLIWRLTSIAKIGVHQERSLPSLQGLSSNSPSRTSFLRAARSTG